MGLDVAALKSREDRSRELLISGESNREISAVTEREFGVAIAATRLAALRKELQIAAKRGRKPGSVTAPAVVTPSAEAPKKRGRPAKAKVKDAKAEVAVKASRKPRKAKSASVVEPAQGEVKSLVRQLVSVMGREKINSITLDRSGKCVLEQRIN